MQRPNRTTLVWFVLFCSISRLDSGLKEDRGKKRITDFPFLEEIAQADFNGPGSILTASGGIDSINGFDWFPKKMCLQPVGKLVGNVVIFLGAGARKFSWLLMESGGEDEGCA